MGDYLHLLHLQDLNLQDPFFDSLKKDYKSFENWFSHHTDRIAIASFKDGTHLLNGLLIYKFEFDQVDGTLPIIRAKKILKISTFKVDSHYTRLGERFIKLALDICIDSACEICYLTIYPNKVSLIKLIERYGFVKYGTNQNEEFIFVKNLNSALTDDVNFDYPRFSVSRNKYLLSIYPKFHSRLFPDSILKNESGDILNDVSYTNSIHKIYITRMKQTIELKPGDQLVIYRTRDKNVPAYYSSVATSICIVESLKDKNYFLNLDDFLSYCSSYSIFSKEELEKCYRFWVNFYVIKMTYNAAFQKRITREKLISLGLSKYSYWGFMKLSDDQFLKIIQEGKISPMLTNKKSL